MNFTYEYILEYDRVIWMQDRIYNDFIIKNMINTD